MPNVNYNGYVVSDKNLKEKLELISDLLHGTINVRSGDGNFRPKGSLATSLHLAKEVVDFHVWGIQMSMCSSF